MIFAMYFITEKKKVVLVPQRLVDFELDGALTRGEVALRGPGTVYFRWGNTHSWFGEKLLSYSVEVNEVMRCACCLSVHLFDSFILL